MHDADGDRRAFGAGELRRARRGRRVSRAAPSAAPPPATARGSPARMPGASATVKLVEPPRFEVAQALGFALDDGVEARPAHPARRDTRCSPTRAAARRSGGRSRPSGAGQALWRRAARLVASSPGGRGLRRWCFSWHVLRMLSVTGRRTASPTFTARWPVKASQRSIATCTYCGSISMARQARPSCSQAISVVPAANEHVHHELLRFGADSLDGPRRQRDRLLRRMEIV